MRQGSWGDLLKYLFYSSKIFSGLSSRKTTSLYSKEIGNGNPQWSSETLVLCH
ncbi:hypothetical protein COO91_08083 [Nostoc flagelliforme CCNUN1]|uniref:Uncharacterized protein n=1 Tax=Nostoc flagelliforme CCNUN1 TaxID=2038116 RepID=A0A2K8T2Q0_9NOSO|nr:hypothetical protein COO91_08083 [Nostoc flagelliforme CCNUN1]